jgi:HEAT repeat protein
VKKRFLIFLAALVIFAAIGIVVIQANKVPYYQGKALDIWSMEAYSGDASQRTQAAVVLGEMGAKAVPRLTRLLRASDSIFSKMVWSHARNLPPATRGTVLKNVAAPNAATVRTAAARSLAIIGTNACSAIPQLIRALSDPDRAVSMAAAAALARIGTPAINPLIAASKDNSPAARQRAVYALGLIGPDTAAAIPDLLARLKDPDDQVRSSAAFSLSAIGPAALPAILDAVSHQTGLVRQGAAKALAFGFPPRRRAVPPLLEMLKDPDPASRVQAIQSLAAIAGSDTSTVATLEGSLNDSNILVRDAAGHALAKLRTTNASADPHP